MEERSKCIPNDSLAVGTYDMLGHATVRRKVSVKFKRPKTITLASCNTFFLDCYWSNYKMRLY